MDNHLAGIEEISAYMAERVAANDIDREARDKLIVTARQANFTWARIAAAAQLTNVATESAAKRGNQGALPKPRNLLTPTQNRANSAV
jgi:hypothetical protein